MSKQTYAEKNKGLLTSSKLESFDFCEMYYYLKYEKMIVPDYESDALNIGTAFDLYEQGEDKFEKWFKSKFYIGTKQGAANKLLCEDAEAKGLTVLTPAKAKEVQNVAKLHHVLTRNPLYKPITKAQENIQLDYKGVTLSGTMDDINLKDEAILDTKCMANIDNLKRFKEKYLNQLTFYQFLVELKHDVKCDGFLKVVTKEDVPKSAIFKVTRETMLDRRSLMLEKIDRYVEAMKTNKFKPCSYITCCQCDAFAVCPFAKQTEYLDFYEI